MNYPEIAESLRQLSALAINRAAHVPSSLLGFETAFPAYAGDDFLAINAYDLSKAPELARCECLAVGNMVFFSAHDEAVRARLDLLDVIGPTA